jgi:hypothetical protein
MKERWLNEKNSHQYSGKGRKIIQHISQPDPPRTDLLTQVALDMGDTLQDIYKSHVRSIGGPLEVGKAGVGGCSIAGGGCTLSCRCFRQRGPYLATTMGNGVHTSHMPHSKTNPQPAPICRTMTCMIATDTAAAAHRMRLNYYISC